MAVVGGTITATVVASLLGAPVGRWLHAAILPLLLAIAGGKAAMILGGQGQGVPWDGPWATAYLGPGPWLSLAPAIPSHPSQAYEALATLLVAAVIAVARRAGRVRAHGGRRVLPGSRPVGDRARASWRSPGATRSSSGRSARTR